MPGTSAPGGGSGKPCGGPKPGGGPIPGGSIPALGRGGTSVGGKILSHEQLTVEGTAGLHLGGMEEHARQAVMCQAGGETFLEVGKVAPVGMGASWSQA